MTLTPYYQDEFTTIYHGDCREVIPYVTASAVVTDPPFKLSQAYAANVDADNLDAVASVIDVARLLLSSVAPGTTAAVFYDNRIMPFGLDAFRRAGWQYLRLLTLYRRWGNAHQLNGWMSTSDPVLLFAAPGERPSFYGEWAHDVYVRSTPEVGGVEHPSQKPLEFVSQIVRRLCPPNEAVIDPFMGSGTTLAAAKVLGRYAIGIETEERYCEFAANRVSAAA